MTYVSLANLFRYFKMCQGHEEKVSHEIPDFGTFKSHGALHIVRTISECHVQSVRWNRQRRHCEE